MNIPLPPPEEIPPEALLPVQLKGSGLKAVAKFTNKYFFEDVKASLNPQHCVECGLCGAIKVEAKELVRALDCLCCQGDNDPTYGNEWASEFFGEMAESVPDKMSDDDERKWYKENRWRLCKTLDENYIFPMCLKYSEAVLYMDEFCPGAMLFLVETPQGSPAVFI